jgi:5-methyltetrahydropteroyltriglutamate--homocysteine methyltransferase
MSIEIYRADHVGSLLRPKNLKEARQKYTDNEITLADLREVEDKEIARIVEKTERNRVKSSI